MKKSRVNFIQIKHQLEEERRRKYVTNTFIRCGLPGKGLFTFFLKKSHCQPTKVDQHKQTQ